MKQFLTILALLLTSIIGVTDQQPTPQQPQLTSAPQALAGIGKPLSILREESPNGVILDRPDGYPDAAAICFGEPDGETAYVFFGTQGETCLPQVMDTYGDELRCSGVLTTAGALFPSLSDDMAFSEFFPLIGVPEYDYIAEDDPDRITGAGWVLFDYDGKWAAMNTNGTGQTVRRDTPLTIIDQEIEAENRQVAEQYLSALPLPS